MAKNAYAEKYLEMGDWQEVSIGRGEAICLCQGLAQFAELVIQIARRLRAQWGQQLVEPLFMGECHGAEVLFAIARHAHDHGAPVIAVRHSFHPAFGNELIGQARDVAAGHHQVLRQGAHAQALRKAAELRQVIKARQGGAELRAQIAADHLLYLGAASQQAQPQAHGLVIVV